MVSTNDFVIVGAGILGLTVAYELKSRYPHSSIAVLEKENQVGMHASGRNSGVLHSGIYYGNATLKAKLCSKGAFRMRQFAAEHGISCNHSGKVIIATSHRDLSTIDRLLKNALENGIKADRLDEKGIREIEPHATPYQTGIHVPDTAVIDSRSVVSKLKALLEAQGVIFNFTAPVIMASEPDRVIKTSKVQYSYGYLFNCAGAGADLLAKQFGLGRDYLLVPFKGIYYKLKPDRTYLVRSNIYPVPDIDLPFLGIHLTRVISGDVYVGPTAIPALGRENYGIIRGMEFGESLTIAKELVLLYLKNKQNFRLLVHSEMQKYLKSRFIKSARKLMAELSADDLVSCDKVGIRPQLVNVRTKSLEMDYIIEQTPASTHVLNAISPAFTSSFAFAELLVDRYENINRSNSL